MTMIFLDEQDRPVVADPINAGEFPAIYAAAVQINAWSMVRIYPARVDDQDGIIIRNMNGTSAFFIGSSEWLIVTKLRPQA